MSRGGAPEGTALKWPLFYLSATYPPKWNAHDLDELPEDVRQSMTFISVEMIDEVLHASLRPGTADEGV